MIFLLCVQHLGYTGFEHRHGLGLDFATDLGLEEFIFSSTADSVRSPQSGSNNSNNNKRQKKKEEPRKGEKDHGNKAKSAQGQRGQPRKEGQTTITITRGPSRISERLFKV